MAVASAAAAAVAAAVAVAVVAAADRVVTSFDGERDDAKAVTADCAEESSPDRRPGVCTRFSSSIAKMKRRQERRRR